MTTQEFSIAFPTLDETHIVAGEEAPNGVLDSRAVLRWLEKAVTAMTGIFGQTVALSNLMHLMPQQIAEVPNSLAKCLPLPVEAIVSFEKQRVPALKTDVFVMPVSHPHSGISVTVQEARDSVTNARFRVVFGEVLHTAATTLGRPPCAVENTIADLMPKQRANHSQIAPPPCAKHGALISGKCGRSRVHLYSAIRSYFGRRRRASTSRRSLRTMSDCGLAASSARNSRAASSRRPACA